MPIFHDLLVLIHFHMSIAQILVFIRILILSLVFYLCVGVIYDYE
jgi:hypothetical protein